MGASPQIPATIYATLAKDFDKQTVAVQDDRKAIAKRIRKLYDKEIDDGSNDFNDDDLDCYEELIVLGLAERCDRCKLGYTKWSKPDHGKNKCEESAE